MGVRDERRAARRREALDLALQIVEEDGLEALTIKGLAARMGASVGGLYRYFPSKESILVALQKEAIEAFRAHLESRSSAVERGRARPVASLASIMGAVEAYLEHAHVEPVRHRLIDQFLSAPEPTLGDEDARAVDATIRPLIALYAGLFDRAVEAGALEPGDAVQRTHVLWALLHGLDHFRKRDRIQPPALQVSALVRVGVDAALRGWGAKAAVVTRARRSVDT